MRNSEPRVHTTFKVHNSRAAFLRRLCLSGINKKKIVKSGHSIRQALGALQVLTIFPTVIRFHTTNLLALHQSEV